VAADRARARAEFASAGHIYLAAAALQAGCRDARATLERARALAFAGAALAQAGDYLRVQTVLVQARDGLADVRRHDPQRASDARRYADLVEQVIAAIDAVARASM
jgi:dsRNA-specific ribonuclease